MEVNRHPKSQTNSDSDSTFCPDFENNATQNNSMSLKSKKKKCNKYSQDIRKLQQETRYCLNAYKRNKNSVSAKLLEIKRSEILNIKKKNNLPKLSLKAFEKKLSHIEEALKERQQNEIILPYNNYNTRNCNLNNLTNQTSVLLVEDSVNEIEILDTSQLVPTDDISKQLATNQIESASDQPLNLCLNNLYNLEEILEVNLNEELDLNENNDDFCKPIDLSFKATHNLVSTTDKNLNNIKINSNLHLNIPKNIQTTSNNSRNVEKITNIIPIKTSLENIKKTTNGLSEAELDAIKEELKAKINDFFAEQLNESDPIQKHNSNILKSYENNESNKENIHNQTENLFQNLWSQSISTPTETQLINYNNDLKDVIDKEYLYRSDGTDTNHIDIDLSIDSKISFGSHYSKEEIISFDQDSISTHTTSNVIHCEQIKPVYNLSDTHVLRLATALNLNVDYLKLQIRLCLMENSRNIYNFDDISVIAPSQSPLNMHRIRQTNRKRFKLFDNLNLTKPISQRREKYNIFKKNRKKLKKKHNRKNDSEFFTNFLKR